MALTQAQYDRVLEESKALKAGNVVSQGGMVFSGGKAYTRAEWDAERQRQNTAAASQLQAAGVDAGTASRYAAATKDLTQNRGESTEDIARRLGAMGRARQRTTLAGKYQSQGLSLADARTRARTEMPNRLGNWDLAMRDAVQLIPGGGSVSSTSHWIFATPQGKAILEKYGLTGAAPGANAPAALAERGGTGWVGGQRFINGRPVSEEDFRKFSGMTQEDLNKTALARRAAMLQTQSAPAGTTATSTGLLLDEEGNVIQPGMAPRLGMAPTVPRMAPPAPSSGGFVADPGVNGGPPAWLGPGPGTAVPGGPAGVAPAPGAGQPAPGAGAAPPPAGGGAPPVTGGPGAGTPPSAIQPRPMSPQVAELLAMWRSRVEGAPITAQDIMNSPEYQAQAGAIDFARESAQAQLRRALASRNMLRSTPAIQSLAGSDAYYTAQEQALVPQMLAAAANRQQQGIRNLSDLLGTVSGLENTAFQQGEAQARFARGVFESDRAFAEDVRRFGLDQAIQQADADLRLARGYGMLPFELEQARIATGQAGAESAEWQAMAPYRMRMAELNQESSELQNQVARLEAELAASPDVGLRAQKQLALQQARVQLQQAQAELALFNDPKVGEAAMRAADIAHTWALANKAGETDTKDADDAVKALTADWNITSGGAKAWLDFSANLEGLGGTGTVSLPDVQELLKAYQGWSGITAEDYNWLAYMAYSQYPGQDASRKLLSRYARRQPKAQESGDESLDSIIGG